MRETFKNVSIFIVFITCLLLWDGARGMLADHFDFRGGKTVLTCIWAVCVVIIFHLLYHFLGKSQEKTIYLSTIFMMILVGGMVYYDKLPLL